MKNLTDDEVKELTNSEEIVFLYLSAIWCAPCVIMSPIIEELSKQYTEVNFVKINIDENPETTAYYGVRTIPTFIILKNNEMIFRHSGATPKSFFVEKIDTLIG